MYCPWESTNRIVDEPNGWMPFSFKIIRNTLKGIKNAITKLIIVNIFFFIHTPHLWILYTFYYFYLVLNKESGETKNHKFVGLSMICPKKVL